MLHMQGLLHISGEMSTKKINRGKKNSEKVYSCKLVLIHYHEKIKTCFFIVTRLQLLLYQSGRLILNELGL